MLLLTPLPVHVPPPPAQGITEDMFVVATTQRIQEIDAGLPPGYPKIPVPLPGTAGVEGRQVIGY